MITRFPTLTLPAGQQYAIVKSVDVERWDRAFATECILAALVDTTGAGELRELARRYGFAGDLADDAAVADCIAEAIVDGRLVPIGLERPNSGRPVVYRTEHVDWSRTVPLADLQQPRTDALTWVSFAVLDRRGRPFAGAEVRVSDADGGRSTVVLDGNGRHVAVGLAKNARLRVELPAISKLRRPQADAAPVVAAARDVELRMPADRTVQLGAPEQHYRIVIGQPAPGFSA